MGADKNKLDPPKNRQHKNSVVHREGETEKGSALVNSKPLGKLFCKVTIKKLLNGLATLRLEL